MPRQQLTDDDMKIDFHKNDVYSKKRYSKKRTTWTKEDEALLVEIWANKIKELLGPGKNGRVFREMSEFMAKKYSPLEIQIKLHNLTNRYKKEKKVVAASRGSKSEWSLYSRIHLILGGRLKNKSGKNVPESFPAPELNCNNNWSEKSDNSVEFSDEPPKSSPAFVSTSKAENKKKRISIFETQMLKIDTKIEKQLETIIESDKKMLSIEEKRNQLLEKLLNSTEQFQEKIFKLMKKD